MLNLYKNICNSLKNPIYLGLLLITLASTARAQQNILRLGGVTTTAKQNVSGGSLGLLTDGNLGDPDVWWNRSAITDSMWIQFKLATAQAATAYKIYFWQGANNNGAGTVLLYASQDGTSWTLLTQGAGNAEPAEAATNNTTAYSFYRFVFKSPVSNFLDFWEIGLYNNVIDVPVLAGTSPNGTQVNLSWNTVLIQSGSYELQKSTDGTTFAPLTTVPYTATSYSDVTGLVQNTPYWYQIRAVKGATTSNFSTPATKVITANDSLKATPTITATAGNIGTLANITWNLTPFNSAGTFQLERSNDGVSFTLLKTFDKAIKTYADSSLQQVTSYWYRVRGANYTSVSPYSANAKITTVNDSLKATPTITATAGNVGTLANITWDLTPFNTAGTFQLERSIDGVNFTLLKTFDKAIKTYADSSLQQATSYWYRVRGFNYTSISPYSALVKITTVSDALTGKPTITATRGNIGNLANITWALTPFTTAGSYQLEKSTDSLNFTVVKIFDKSVTTYADSSLSRSTTYWYRVKGVNYTSSSPYSNNAKVTTISDSLLTAPTLTATASGTIGTQATLTWSLNIALPGTFELEKSTDGISFTLFKTFDKSVTSYIDSTLTHNTNYWYRVRGLNAVSPSPYSPVRQIKTRNDSLLVAPVLQVTAPTGTQANLSWTYGTTIPGNGGFIVEKSLDGVSFTPIGLNGMLDKSITSYIEQSLNLNTSYWYRVKAYDYINVSPYSNIVKVTTNSFASTPADITDDGGKLYVSADNSGGANAAEGSTRFIDNDVTTKWLVFTGQASANLAAVYKPTGSYIVTGYSLSTANDSPPRDPKNWVFEGSADSTVWVTLDAQTNQLGNAAARFTTFNYSIANPGTVAYRFYRITFTANNGATDGVRFQIGEWQIFGLDPASPDIPQNLKVTGTTTSTVSLAWLASTPKVATKYVLQRSVDGLFFNLVDTLSGTTITYTDTMLYDSTNYYYRVQALGTTKTAVSGWSNVASGLTKFTDGTPLSPINLKIGTVVDTIVNMSWKDRSYNETGFTLQRSTDKITFTDIKSYPANTTFASDSTVWPATKYYYRVYAVNGQVVSGYSNIDSTLTTGYNHPPMLTIPLLVKNACSNKNQITAYIANLIPGTVGNEKTQQLRIASVAAADTTSAKYFSSYSYTNAVINGVATFAFTGSGYGNAGDTAKLIVTVKDNGGIMQGGIDSLSIPVTVIFAPLTIAITADRDVTNVPKYVTVHLAARSNYPSTTPSYTWDVAPGINGSRNNSILNVEPVAATTYTVHATNTNGCTATTQITVTPDAGRLITNVLTPNGDGKNDKWIVWGITQNVNNSVKIFDREGRLIFYQKNYTNDWDARYKGKVLDEGAYYYTVDYGDGSKVVTGVLNIIKDHK